MSSPTSPHDIACRLAEELSNSEVLSEADTRHRIIDSVIHDILSWPRASVVCESYINPGYADYVLLGRSSTNALFIEAKKEGIYFELPAPYDDAKLSGMMKVKTLMTHNRIKAAMEQVRIYCLDKGCEYAAITNGHQWIFFKVFERNSDWRDLSAFYIRSLHFFSQDFTKAINTFGYLALMEDASLAQLLGNIQIHKRERFSPSTKIPEYNHGVHNNFLASAIRPLAQRYLGIMNPTDDEFMHRCYVNIRDYQDNVNKVSRIINDCLTPYFKDYNVREFFDDFQGGEFGKRISSHLRERRTREVIILFGGKGAGKSTFIKKLLYHRPPKVFIDHSVIGIIDLLECPEDQSQITTEIWRQLVAELDKEQILEKDRESLLSLFNDRFKIAKRQYLAGLDINSDLYNSQLNSLVKEWIYDLEYCAMRLADYWKTREKGVIIVLDNTDQFNTKNQDFCFTIAQKIASIVDGLVVISMREERFFSSKLHGTLDAFQNNGFHLSSPPAHNVFIRRLLYILRKLDNPQQAQELSPSLTGERNEKVKILCRIFIREFRREGSHLEHFLRACSHGNIRLGLEMFRQFLLSGYTKVGEMLDAGSWNLQVHQVLRPMMIPDRFFYDESLSSIPNLYQLRTEYSSSHFTGLRILDLLSSHNHNLNSSLVPIAKLKSEFAERYKMLDDLYANLDIMLRSGLVESNNRLDEYSDSVDSIKITPYGFYMRHTLSGMFSYLDLISVDTTVHNQTTAHSIAQKASEELKMFLDGVKGERVELRLSRVDEFIKYLQEEAAIERDYYSLDYHETRYADELAKLFEDEQKRVRNSAKRYVEKQTDN